MTQTNTTHINIKNIDVEIVKRESTIGIYFCAYATLYNSRFLHDNFLGHPTFREDDKVGIDTAHGFNMKQTELEKYQDAISQISFIIDKWDYAINGNYIEE